MALRILFVALVMSSWGPSPALAGWVVRQTVGASPAVIFMQDNMVKTRSPSREVVFDLNRNLITLVDLRNRRYWRGDPQDFARRAREAALELVRARLSRLAPDERRAQLERFKRDMGLDDSEPRPAPPVRVEPVGAGAALAGFPTKRYEIWVGGRLRQELWAAVIPGLAKDLDLARFFKMLRALEPGARHNWRLAPQVLELRSREFPLKIVDYRPARKRVTLVRKMERKTLPPGTWRTPAGFRKESLKDFLRRP
jgi:hypothetical protein